MSMRLYLEPCVLDALLVHTQDLLHIELGSNIAVCIMLRNLLILGGLAGKLGGQTRAQLQ